MRPRSQSNSALAATSIASRNFVPTLRQQFHFVRGDKQELLRLERCYETEGCATGQRWSFVADHAVRNAYSIFCRKRDCQLMKQHHLWRQHAR